MSKLLIKCFLLINILITVFANELFDNYADPESTRDDYLLKLLKNYLDKSREYRALDNGEIWPQRWFPEKPSDPTPPPKIPHKSNNIDGHEQNLETDVKNLKNLEKWTGRWFPGRPSDPTPPPKIPHKFKPQDNSKAHPAGMIPMGVKSSECDDGKTNLTVDWDHSKTSYTCYSRKLWPNVDISPLLYCEEIPKHYTATHKCMSDVIEYDDELPLYGTHRPIWPVYGEYKFIPKQRWLHSLEHGAVVMLYHPCAHPLEVERLKKLVTGCIRRHIISPSYSVNYERPFALLTWGCRLTMSYVDPEIVTKFISQYALKGPEEVEDDGDFDDALLQKAKIVTDIEDSVLCPKQFKI